MRAFVIDGAFGLAGLRQGVEFPGIIIREVIEEIRQRLALYVPREVAPEGRPRAAVLVPLYFSHDELHVLFTKRSDLMEHHKGEIAFPGGGYEPVDEGLMATALREAEEEIGLRPADVRVLGRLDDIITTSAFHVTVYVGEVITAVPYEWCYQEDEVACLLEVPMAHLLDGSNLVEFELERRGEVVMRQGYRFGEHIIWGATGQMLRNFLEVAIEPLPLASPDPSLRSGQAPRGDSALDGSVPVPQELADD